MKLRVALVALYPAPGAKAPGGVRAVVQSLVGGLRAYDDLELHIVHCHGDISRSAVVEDGQTTVHYVGMPRRRLVPNTLVAILRVERLLRQLRPAVVNAHAAHYTVAALRAGYPTVFTIHGVVQREAEVYRSTWFDRSRYWLEGWCERYALRRVQDIVAIGDYVVEEYRGRTRARFHRIDNPLPGEFFALPDLQEEGRLLYTGTIDERKNVLELLRALTMVRERVPAARLRIAGRTTNPAYHQQVLEFVSAQGLAANVDFVGLLDKAQLLDEYARCAAVVLASRQETAPMAVIEAMAAAKAVVATRVGGIPDVVEEGGSALLAEPGDVPGLAQCMVDVLSDADLRLRLGRRGRQLAARYRQEVVVSQYRQLYYQIAGRAMP